MMKVNGYMQMIVAQAICKEITKDEMKQRGWDELDVVLITGETIFFSKIRQKR